MVFYFGTGARCVNGPAGQGGIPVKIANREREPSFGRHFYYVRWGSPGVPRAGDALHSAIWRNPDLDGIALGPSAKFFEQVANGRR